MNNSEKAQISKEVSKYLFLANLINSNDDKIESLITSLKTIVQNKANNKIAYLSSLEQKLKYIRNQKLIKEFEEEKAKLN